MNKAIQKAIEGGYEHNFEKDRFGRIVDDYNAENTMVLDPLFWQALCGKEKDAAECEGKWLHDWHSFIDHLAKGKDINSFFEKLLKE